MTAGVDLKAGGLGGAVEPRLVDHVISNIGSQMLNRLGFGRFFRAPAEHRNFTELADDMEQMAHALIDRSRGPFGHRTYLEASERWEWQLGNDLLLLLRYARDHVPSAAAELHEPARTGPPRASAAHRVVARLTRSPS
jgi:hypothetical protein